MLKSWIREKYITARANMWNKAKKENGDTNFISIIIILGIVI